MSHNIPGPRQISATAVSQRLRRCLLTWHRKAEGRAAASQTRKEKRHLARHASRLGPGHTWCPRGGVGGRGESSVALAERSLTWQMALGVCFWQRVPRPCLRTNQRRPLAVNASAPLWPRPLLWPPFPSVRVIATHSCKTRRPISCLCVKDGPSIESS